MEGECKKQQCDVADVIVDNFYELCSSEFKKRDEKLQALVQLPSNHPRKKKGPGKRGKADLVAGADNARAAGSASRAGRPGGRAKRHRAEDEDPVRPPPLRSTQSSLSVMQDESADVAPPPKKKARQDEPAGVVPPPKKKARQDESADGAQPLTESARLALPEPVLKVSPSEFPKEMSGDEDVDPSTPEDLNTVFTPDGFYPADDARKSNIVQKYQTYREILPAGTNSNFPACAICEQNSADNGLVFCIKCPRAYHKKCFETFLRAEEKCVEIESSQKGTCIWCEWDTTIRPGEDITTTPGDKRELPVQEAYAKYHDSEGYKYMCMMISHLLQILERLTKYTFGDIFSHPGDFCSCLCQYPAIF